NPRRNPPRPVLFGRSQLGAGRGSPSDFSLTAKDARVGYASAPQASKLRGPPANRHGLAVLDLASVSKRARGENFPVASLAFPRDLRPHIRALYAYARLVDILGDELEGGREARLGALDELEGEVDAAYRGVATWPVLVELEPTIREFDR